MSASQARFVWQEWRFQYLHKCQRKLGDEGGPMDADGLLRDRRDSFSISGSICVGGVALSEPEKMSAEAWRRRGAHGRRRSFA